MRGRVVPALATFSLPRRLRATFAQLARVILTDEVDRLGITGDVVAEVELFLRSIPTPMRLGLVAGLHAFDQSARAVPSSLGRSFSSLPLELAEAHFERWWESNLPPLHQFAKAARMFVTFAYYEHPRVRESLGYDPESWIAKVSAERRERFASEIEEHEAMVRAPNPLRPPPRPPLPRGLPTAEVADA